MWPTSSFPIGSIEALLWVQADRKVRTLLLDVLEGVARVSTAAALSSWEMDGRPTDPSVLQSPLSVDTPSAELVSMHDIRCPTIAETSNIMGCNYLLRCANFFVRSDTKTRHAPPLRVSLP